MKKLGYWQKRDRVTGTVIIAVILLTCISFISSIYRTRVRVYRKVFVRFEDIGNLKLENPVKIMGVERGLVSRITRDAKAGKALIEMKIHKGIKIRENYKVLNEDVGLMGDRIINLVPGDSGASVSPADTLDGKFLAGIAEKIPRAEIRSFVEGDPESGEEKFTVQFTKMASALGELSAGIETFIMGNKEEWSRSINQLGSLSRDAAEFSYTARGRIGKDIDTLNKYIDKVNSGLKNLSPYIDTAAVFAARVDSGKGYAGAIINDSLFYREMTDVLASVKGLLTHIKNKKARLPVNLHIGRKHSRKPSKK
ncbi:MAG: MlaD family protein [Fibrobacterota bacterium]